MSLTSPPINRLRRITRNLSRILSSKSTYQSQRFRQCLIFVLLLVPFLLVLYTLSRFRYLPSLLGTHRPQVVPRSFDASTLQRSLSRLPPLRIIVVVAPFTPSEPNANNSTTPHYDEHSLVVLMTSLRLAQYDGTAVDLHVILAPHAQLASFEHVYHLVSSLEWPHGALSIANATTGGLFEHVLSAWTPTRGMSDAAVLVEASRTAPFTSNWYRYATTARIRYARRADVAAFALQPASRTSVLGMAAETRADVDQDVLFHTGAAHIGVLLPASVDVWRAFQRWFVAQRADWFLWPDVLAAKDKKDAAWNSYRGTVRAHWTLWFSRFCALHGLYTVYPRQMDPLPLLVNASKSGAQHHVVKLAFDGSVVPSNGAADGSSLIDAGNVDQIVQLGYNHNGMVSLTVVNEAFLETAQSWICNVDTAGIRPPGIVWITTDDVAYEALRKVRGSYAVRMSEMKGGSTGTSYGTPGYWLMMLERTFLIRDLVDRGVAVFAFETDQVWMRDPVAFVNRLVHNGDEVDMVGTLDTRHEIGGNFLFLQPTLATRRVWHEVCRRFLKAYRAHRMSRRSARSRKYLENDQSSLTKLVLFDEAFKSRNPVVFRALDTELFVDGRWYDGKRQFYRSAKSRSPIMINNNFLVGIDNKKKRLLEHGHWFVRDGRCAHDVVEAAIATNEQQGDKAGDALNGRRLVRRNGMDRRVIEGADVEADVESAVRAVGKEIG